MRFIILLSSLLFFTTVSIAEDEEVAPEVTDAPEVIYHKLEPQFIVNLQGEKHYLRTAIQLQLKSDDTKAALKEHNVPIRHALILLLSDNEAADLTYIQGREVLRLAAIEELNNTLKKYAGIEGIENVFFTEFVSQ